MPWCTSYVGRVEPGYPGRVRGALCDSSCTAVSPAGRPLRGTTPPSVFWAACGLFCTLLAVEGCCGLASDCAVVPPDSPVGCVPDREWVCVLGWVDPDATGRAVAEEERAASDAEEPQSAP